MKLYKFIWRLLRTYKLTDDISPQILIGEAYELEADILERAYDRDNSDKLLAKVDALRSNLQVTLNIRNKLQDTLEDPKLINAIRDALHDDKGSIQANNVNAPSTPFNPITTRES